LVSINPSGCGEREDDETRLFFLHVVYLPEKVVEMEEKKDWYQCCKISWLNEIVPYLNLIQFQRQLFLKTNILS